MKVRRKIHLPPNTATIKSEQRDTDEEEDSEPDTPIAPPSAHHATFAFDNSAFLVSSPHGQIPVEQIPMQEAQLANTEEPVPGPSNSANLPPTSAQRDLQTKMRHTRNRTSSHPSDLAYPLSRTAKAKTALESRENSERAASDAQQVQQAPPKAKYQPPRGPNGKFIKRKP